MVGAKPPAAAKPKSGYVPRWTPGCPCHTVDTQGKSILPRTGRQIPTPYPSHRRFHLTGNSPVARIGNATDTREPPNRLLNSPLDGGAFMPPCRVQSSGWVSVASTPSYACKGVPALRTGFALGVHAGLQVFVFPVSAARTAQGGVPNALTDSDIVAARAWASFPPLLVDWMWRTKCPAVCPPDS